ncbi:MAG TPA: exodeoxyribonuclease V subunit gamma [Jatrophihabitans sp.]|jgi:exodeoxyribonuclease V gamma subunit|uniref:exodeoxyribonuclease V subunit gamma n=1 Tax=Jatrophihabitans sp. TaxID=1932789 RepID=UPI002F24C375
MLHVHRAERADTLATALAGVLATPLADPFSPEVIAVPARGVERWLTQHLSAYLGGNAGDGIAANLAFPSLADLADSVIAAASGMTAAEDPWAPARLTWTTLNAIDSAIGQPWCTQLTAHLDEQIEVHRSGRRYATAALLTSLYRTYGADRPAMLRDWAAGNDTNGLGQTLSADLAWQAQLWREIRDQIGPNPAERLPDVLARLTDQPGLSDLPDRMSVFGPTRVNTSQLEVLSALAAHRDVHLWLHHPSPALWDALTTTPPPVNAVRDPALPDAVINPLLASLGRDVRELQQRLPAGRTDIHHPAQAQPRTVLSALQGTIRSNTPRPASARPADSSVRIYACHGPARQVEVLREALLHTFTELPGLQPRDVLIMCPDIDTYAPLIQAAFGRTGTHPGHQLRVRLADRSPSAANPLFDVVTTLLQLAGGRLRASELLDFAALPPVAARFGFTRTDLTDLADWARGSGIRWGITHADRARFDLPGIAANTATAGLDRLLLGVTAEDGTLATLGKVLPLPDIDSSDIDLTGRFAEFMDRTQSLLARFTGARPVTEWADILRDGLDLLIRTRTRDSWQRAQLDRELGEATEHGADTVLRLPDIRALLASRLASRPTRANFRTGELTVSTLVPMRSVPHRVIALLGMDDEAFPRQTHFDGDDILARTPCIGERDPRHEDRQLLLDAVMAATDRLVVTYSGADPATGQPRPPAAPIADILDALATVTDTSVEDRQPLQPFDPRSFAEPDPFSHDIDALAGALALQAPSEPVVLLPAPLPPSPVTDLVEVAELAAFLRNPYRGFLRQRLGITVDDDPEALSEEIPVEMSGLDSWQVGTRVVTGLLAGSQPWQVAGAETARGVLPPAELGRKAGNDVYARAVRIASAAQTFMTGPASLIDVNVDLGDGRRLSGTVTGIHDRTIVVPLYGRLHAQQRVEAWIRLLAAARQDPSVPWRAVTIGWGGSQANPGPWRSILTAPEDPARLLAQLAALRELGLSEPLPLPVASAAAFTERAATGSRPEVARRAAEQQWQSTYDAPGEADDPACVYLYGPDMTFETLWTQPATAFEAGWRGAAVGRFAALALHVWEPLLAHETMGPA